MQHGLLRSNRAVDRLTVGTDVSFSNKRTKVQTVCCIYQDMLMLKMHPRNNGFTVDGSWTMYAGIESAGRYFWICGVHLLEINSNISCIGREEAKSSASSCSSLPRPFKGCNYGMSPTESTFRLFSPRFDACGLDSNPHFLSLRGTCQDMT